jgi:hypothetical protein
MAGREEAGVRAWVADARDRIDGHVAGAGPQQDVLSCRCPDECLRPRWLAGAADARGAGTAGAALRRFLRLHARVEFPITALRPTRTYRAGSRERKGGRRRGEESMALASTP